MKTKVMGQYVYWDVCGCVYVGQSDNIMSRIQQHGDRFKHSLLWIFDRTSEYRSLSYEGVKALLRWDEAALIEQYDPEENKMRPKCSADWLQSMPLDAQKVLMARTPDLTTQ